MKKKWNYDSVKKYIESQNYKLLSTEYKNVHQKLKLQCWCGHIWNKVFWDFLKGSRCPLHSNNQKMNFDKLSKEFLKYGFNLIDTNTGSTQKSHIICKEGHDCFYSLKEVRRGYKCKICSGFKRYTYEEIRKIFSDKGYTLLTTEFKPALEKVNVLCPNGHNFKIRRNNFQQGQGCPYCNGGIKLSYDSVKKYIESQNYKLLSTEYKNALTKLKILCSNNHEFEMRYNDFQQGQRCPHCSYIDKKSKVEKIILEYIRSFYNGTILENDRSLLINPKTNKSIELDIFLPDLNKAIEYNGIYWHSKENVKYRDNQKLIQCKNKGIDLLVIEESDWLENSQKCLNDIYIFLKSCYHKKNIWSMKMDSRHSNNLKEIEDFLIKENIPYKINEQDIRIFHLNEGKLELRYVDSENHKMDYEKRFGIKGIPHNYFINITKENKKNGIRTIWIKDWEMESPKTIKNIYGKELLEYRRKWEVLKSYILTGTGNVRNRIFARDCEIRVVPNSELRPFLEENCFYGYRPATVNLGLYLKKNKNNLKKNTLLMVYTFGYPFYSKGLYDVEVIRVATKLYCQVIGGASKLLTHFLKNYPVIYVGSKKKEVKVNKIVFIVDADHNDGRSLETLGFKFFSHEGHGFMNVNIKTGKVFQRKPMQHKIIMEKMRNGEIYSVANAGSIIYTINRSEYLQSIGYKENDINPISCFFS